jgi:pectinesterase inhibitor-like protein
VICRTQAKFGKASDTSALRRLGDTAEKSAGAVVWMLVPWIQLSVQDSKTDLKAVSMSIKAMCSQTDYTDACEKSLGKAANGSSSSPKDIVRSAVEVIGDAISQAFDRANLILSSDPRVKAAVAYCKEVFANAKDDLNSTLKGVDDKDGIAKQSYQLRACASGSVP